MRLIVQIYQRTLAFHHNIQTDSYIKNSLSFPKFIPDLKTPRRIPPPKENDAKTEMLMLELVVRRVPCGPTPMPTLRKWSWRGRGRWRIRCWQIEEWEASQPVRSKTLAVAYYLRRPTGDLPPLWLYCSNLFPSSSFYFILFESETTKAEAARVVSFIVYFPPPLWFTSRTRLPGSGFRPSCPSHFPPNY